MSTGRLPASVISAVRDYTTLAVLAGSVFGRLWAYQLAALWRGRSSQRAARVLQCWSRWACRWPLRLDVDSTGTTAGQPCVYVANHRTYLDIPVLSAVLGGTFLSRADIAAMPLLGAAAKEVGAVFVERDDTHGRMRAARALLRALATSSVVVFAEGTTGGAVLPGVFEPGLFRLLQRIKVPVIPVTTRYSDRRAYWVDDLSMWQHLRRDVLSGGRLRVVVDIGGAVRAADYPDAAALGAAIRTAVCRPIEEQGELA